MIDAGAAIWTEGRVFVTPAVGCPAQCAFCYLEDLGAAKATQPRLAGDALYATILEDRRFTAGPAGTLISLGCLSESLAPHSAEATLAFVQAAAGARNPIQIATRWVVRGGIEEALRGAIQKAGAVMFQSFSTLSLATRIERGTPPLKHRLAFIREWARARIPSVLYIKPYISGVTSQDAAQFAELAKSGDFACAVVGPLFQSRAIADAIDLRLSPSSAYGRDFAITDLPVSSNPPRWTGELPAEVRTFEAELTGVGMRVFQHSRDALDHLRERMGAKA